MRGSLGELTVTEIDIRWIGGSYVVPVSIVAMLASLGEIAPFKAGSKAATSIVAAP